MPLSLHAEYLLGYLSGARGVNVRDVVPLALANSTDVPQSRALLKALALGMSDGRRGRTMREAHEVRLHVLTLLTRETSPSRLGRAHDSMGPQSGMTSDAPSDPSIAIEDFIRQAGEIQ